MRQHKNKGFHQLFRLAVCLLLVSCTWPWSLRQWLASSPHLATRVQHTYSHPLASGHSLPVVSFTPLLPGVLPGTARRRHNPNTRQREKELWRSGRTGCAELPKWKTETTAPTFPEPPGSLTGSLLSWLELSLEWKSFISQWKNGKCTEVQRLNIQLISSWIGSKTKMDPQKVLEQRKVQNLVSNSGACG